MFNYATQSNLINAASVDRSKFVKNNNLSSLKLDFDELDIAKLKTVPVEWSKLSNVLKKFW